MRASHIPPSKATHTNTHLAGSDFTERHPHTDTDAHTLGFHICPLSLPPSLNFYLLRSSWGHPRLQLVATVTLSDVTSGWKEVCVCVFVSAQHRGKRWDSLHEWPRRLLTCVKVMGRVSDLVFWLVLTKCDGISKCYCQNAFFLTVTYSMVILCGC